MVIEGSRCIRHALNGGVVIEQLFVCQGMVLDGDVEPLARGVASAGGRVFEVPQPVLDKIAYRSRSQGLLAVARTGTYSLADLPLPPGCLLVVAENLEKPGNLGAILRSADAAGAHGLILCDKRTDVSNPNVITASTGTVFSVPIAEAPADQTLTWLNDRGVTTLAATPDGDCAYTEVDMTGPIAILLGSEHLGLSETFHRGADRRLVVPMRGAADSLNVAATATVLLFEAARQRQAMPDR